MIRQWERVIYIRLYGFVVQLSSCSASAAMEVEIIIVVMVIVMIKIIISELEGFLHSVTRSQSFRSCSRCRCCSTE